MFRYVVFQEKGILVKGNKAREIKEGRHLLELENSYFFNACPFYVMRGHGDIEFRHLPFAKPSFSRVRIENLDYFLQTGEHKSLDYREQEQIESFLKIYKINEAHNSPKLYTEEYNDLERGLFEYQSLVSIERY